MTITPPVNRFYAEPVEKSWPEIIADYLAATIREASVA